jgi:hypothetical protein
MSKLIEILRLLTPEQLKEANKILGGDITALSLSNEKDVFEKEIADWNANIKHTLFDDLLEKTQEQIIHTHPYSGINKYETWTLTKNDDSLIAYYFNPLVDKIKKHSKINIIVLDIDKIKQVKKDKIKYLQYNKFDTCCNKKHLQTTHLHSELTDLSVELLSRPIVFLMADWLADPDSDGLNAAYDELVGVYTTLPSAPKQTNIKVVDMELYRLLAAMRRIPAPKRNLLFPGAASVASPAIDHPLAAIGNNACLDDQLITRPKTHYKK